VSGSSGVIQLNLGLFLLRSKVRHALIVTETA